MNDIQKKLLYLLERGALEGLSLREIGERIEEDGSPQKIKHHIDQLVKKGLISFDTKKKRLEKMTRGEVAGTPLVSLPIFGTADCGIASHFADDYPEGYLKISKTLLGSLAQKIEDLFVVRAAGNSMNRAHIEGQSIDSGDYVIVDRSFAQQKPKNGDYILSVIDGVANIKKVSIDEEKKHIVLSSESYQDIPPIFIHEDDLESYIISGKVMRVMKEPGDSNDFRNAGAIDVLKDLGPMSKEEHDYYMNL